MAQRPDLRQSVMLLTLLDEMDISDEEENINDQTNQKTGQNPSKFFHLLKFLSEIFVYSVVIFSLATFL